MCSQNGKNIRVIFSRRRLRASEGSFLCIAEKISSLQIQLKAQRDTSMLLLRTEEMQYK